MVDVEYAWNVLERLTIAYEIDVAAHYATDNSTKKAPGRNPARFNFFELSEKVFGDVPATKLHDLYVKLFEIYPLFIEQVCREKFGSCKSEHSYLHLSELILSVIVPYQLPLPVARKAKACQGEAKKAKVVPAPKVQLKLEHSKKLLPHLLPIPLYSESKMWKQIKYILVPDGKESKLKELAPICADALAKGKISFAALSFCMQDSILGSAMAPSALLYALYLGPVKAATIEQFACNRSSEFRKACKDLVETANIARTDPTCFYRYRPENLPGAASSHWTFRDFANNTADVVREMKGVKRPFAPISPNWAYAAIKKFGKRTYVDETWSEENLYDLIWTIMVQRPNMKKFICKTLEEDFRDYGAAKYWRKMQPAQMDRVYIRNKNVKNINLLDRSPEFLNFPPEMTEISIIETSAQLSSLMQIIADELVQKGSLIVGLDAEWSAFTGDSKASILQMALRDRVFIIDLEAEKALPHENLRSFFRQLFSDARILKLGFQFSEDLFQMRNAISHCGALYRPENLICVGRLLADLLAATEKLEEKMNILAEVCPHMSSLNSNNDSTSTDENDKVDLDVSLNESVKSDSSESMVSKLVNKGLSSICEQVLGAPLDKQEQCSVWDRRPLRDLQTRYAAMDAYCLLMLYDVCDTWAKRLGSTVVDYIKKQSPHRCSLPLFSDDT